MKFRNADPRLITILLIVFAQFVGASMVLPVLPLYARRHFGMEPEAITLLVSSFFAAQFLAGPTLGRLSDNYGRLPVLIISQIGTVISFLMLAFAGAPWVLFASRILDGITGGNIIVAQAYITDVMPREKRTEALGLIFAALGLGFVFGPALGGVFSALFNEQAPFLIAAVGTFVPLVLTYTTLDETLTPEQREQNRTKGRRGLAVGEVLRNKELLLILLIAFIGQFGLGVVQSTFALYGEAVLFAGQSEDMVNLGVGLLLGMIGVGQLFTQLYLLRRMLKRYDESLLVILGALLRGLAMFSFVVITSPWLGAPTALVFATGTGLMMPPLQSLSTDTVSDALRGGVLGWYQSSISLAIIFSTALAGVLFSITPQTPYLLGGVLFMVTLIPAFLLVRRHRPVSAVPTAASD
ncbi:MAG: tetracycline resistance MFS efflux pump [Anaerolineae bacterium]